MPKISVIVPIYNVETYLKQALESVLNQTLSDLEIICINDGSTDASLEIIKQYAENDNRIKIINKENSGYGDSCNKGIDTASGEYIAILEPDDYIEKNMYEVLFDAAKKYDTDIVKCKYSEINEFDKNKKINAITWFKNQKKPNGIFKITDYPIFLFYHPSIWSCLYKKSFLKENDIKFPTPKGAGWADNLFQVKTLCLAQKIIYIDYEYYKYRRHYNTECEALKDYKIPLERSIEIHQWLKHQNITDENILANIYKREFTYIKLALCKIGIKDLKTAFSYIEQILKEINETIIKNNSIFNSRERSFYRILKYVPLIAFTNENILKIRKEVFSIRWNKEEKSIRLFGRIVYNA